MALVKKLKDGTKRHGGLKKCVKNHNLKKTVRNWMDLPAQFDNYWQLCLYSNYSRNRRPIASGISVFPHEHYIIHNYGTQDRHTMISLYSFKYNSVKMVRLNSFICITTEALGTDSASI